MIVIIPNLFCFARPEITAKAGSTAGILTNPEGSAHISMMEENVKGSRALAIYIFRLQIKLAAA
jgi:hypothetical protein